MIFVPIAIGVANRLDSVCKSCTARCIYDRHVYVLPFNSKPAAL